MKATPENKPKKSNNFDYLNKITKSKLKSKAEKKSGGTRSGAGRPRKEDKEAVRQMKDLIEGHGLEAETVNGKKQARVSILLTVLFREGAKGNIAAIREYLDRQIGKSTESIELGNKDDRVFKVKISTVGNKSNGDKLGTNQKTE